MWRYGILGSVELREGERQRPLVGPRQVALLGMLLIQRNRGVSSDRLIEAVWPDAGAAGGRERLRVAVGRLRRALDPAGRAADSPLRTLAGGYLLAVHPSELDAELFEARLSDGRGALERGDPRGARELLHEASALWRGPALADLGYHEFAQAEIRRLQELRVIALETRVEADLRLGRHAEVVAELEALNAAHPTRERLTGQLMVALYRSGRQADALAAYRDARAALVEQLGIEPGPQLRDLERAILAQDAELDGVELADDPPHGPGPPVRGLPARTTTLFGRQDDLDALAALAQRARLVTLTGPGGVGKTSLALELAHRLAPAFRDGGRWIELAGVRDPAHVPAAIAQGLGVKSRDTETLAEAVMRFLATRRLLLVLDNFEHLLDAAPLVTELLRASAHAVVVCTSREALQLSAERVFPVGPLALPGEDPAEPCASVAMFCDRAEARDPTFALGADSARAVATVCRRLGGLPLALELAAAQLGFLSPQQLVTQLDDTLGLLVGGSRDAPERQRTLRATLEWSNGLLNADERRAFARFAVFAGGATLDAAVAVTQADSATSTC
jgi:DNA-binding SARP family transcriptional activator